MGITVRRVLISVHDKRGVIDFARGLRDAGCEILSSGGTYRSLKEQGIDAIEISAFTGSPEVMGGRVKTLHPKIHGGILARRGREEDERALEELAAKPIDLVVVNLYPFEKVSSLNPEDVTAVIENIDIGGPALVRSAAKNFAHVGVVVDPDDYPAILAELADLSGETRLNLARKAFERVEAYDRAIADYFMKLRSKDDVCRFAFEEDFPEQFSLLLKRSSMLRYGENSHQKAALYVEAAGGAAWKQIQGKEISYNNWLDSDAAWKCAREFERPVCAIIKHNNPCGVAENEKLTDAWMRAIECDPVSAYGGIVAVNRVVTEELARLMSEIFLEVVVAPGFDAAALAILSGKKALRLLEVPSCFKPSRRDIRSISVGVLIQDSDLRLIDNVTVVTQKKPDDRQIDDMLFAWKVAKHVRSNAIVIALEAQAIGVGAGQMSRVDSVKLAVSRARKPLAGAALASDGFFPFPDGVEEAARSGVTSIIQPGGSVRDHDIIAAADRLGLSMAITGMRHFRH